MTHRHLGIFHHFAISTSYLRARAPRLILQTVICDSLCRPVDRLSEISKLQKDYFSCRTRKKKNNTRKTQNKKNKKFSCRTRNTSLFITKYEGHKEVQCQKVTPAQGVATQAFQGPDSQTKEEIKN